MKWIPLAALTALGLFYYASSAGADEGAYKNLVGMAQAAAADRGPDADDSPERATTKPEALKDAIADVPAAPKAGAAPGAFEVRSAVPVSAPTTAPAAVPAGTKTRLWTRLYSTLLPSWRRSSLESAFDPMLSTAAVRSMPSPSPASDSEAVIAGERRGLSELMSVPAPASAQ